ncbi:MAG: formate dehydrogenase subunit delta [Deltaproteobacteria bacterium]|nr:formate dehydrogenase subunit delta [Deltaproteobacteria bacterium]
MDIHHLVKMANDIGTFYATLPDRNEAINSIAAHLKNFWEPRMRREIIDFAKRGAEHDPRLMEIVREAILTLQMT